MDSNLSPANQGYVGFQDLASGAGDFNAVRFILTQMLGRLATATVVQVQGVDTTAQTVDIQPLVNQVDGAGNATPHGTIFSCPYVRLQGGANAVVLDPSVGDIGVAVFASRDISSVKANKGRANPGSRRTFDYADAMYLGGLLNGVPTQYVKFTGGGVEVVSPTLVTITAPTIELDGAVHMTGAVTGDSTATFEGEVEGSGIKLSTHPHGGVTTGTGTSGGPLPS